MVRTMGEIRKDQVSFGSIMRATPEEVQKIRLTTAPESTRTHEADTAARAIGDELDQLETLAAQVVEVRNRLRVKARDLYTSAQVGNAQASEAELVAGPLRRRIEDLGKTLETALAENRMLRDQIQGRTGGWTTGPGHWRTELAQASTRMEELNERIANMAGWLDLKNGELASANAQRDAARAQVEELKDALSRLQEAGIELATQRDQARARAERAERKLAEIAGLVIGPTLDQALSAGKDPADYATHLAEVLLEIRSVTRSTTPARTDELKAILVKVDQMISRERLATYYPGLAEEVRKFATLDSASEAKVEG